MRGLRHQLGCSGQYFGRVERAGRFVLVLEVDIHVRRHGELLEPLGKRLQLRAAGVAAAAAQAIAVEVRGRTSGVFNSSPSATHKSPIAAAKDLIRLLGKPAGMAKLERHLQQAVPLQRRSLQKRFEARRVRLEIRRQLKEQGPELPGGSHRFERSHELGHRRGCPADAGSA
jgi:hypothetical protein